MREHGGPRRRGGRRRARQESTDTHVASGNKILALPVLSGAGNECALLSAVSRFAAWIQNRKSKKSQLLLMSADMVLVLPYRGQCFAADWAREPSTHVKTLRTKHFQNIQVHGRSNIWVALGHMILALG